MSILSIFQYVLQLTNLATSKIHLPPPTGPYSVGLQSLRINHTTLNDPFAPNHTGTSILVRLYYPTDTQPSDTSIYLPPATSRWFEEAASLPESLLTTIHAHSTPDASIVELPPGELFPTILFSPGGGLTSLVYTTYFEDLASRGFVVAAIDHPYEAMVVEFPDGEIVEGTDLSNMTGNLPFRNAFYGFRVTDAVFVAENLHTLPFGELLNTTHLGIFGHSMGSAATAGAMAALPEQISCGAPLDGVFWGKSNETDLQRPVILLNSVNNTQETRAEFPLHQSGWVRDLNVTGTKHVDFTDMPAWIKLLGMDPADFAEIGFGGIDGERIVEIVRAYLGDFFGWCLRGREGKLLQGPSEKFPEVVFVDRE